MTNAEFFDAVYAAAENDDAAVPWQGSVSRRIIGEWIGGFAPSGDERAMVVAAGLGDDAAALAAKGVDVVAFDYSPTAVAWAQSRHADAEVVWHQADLFDLPPQWVDAFDLVIEVFTVQATQPDRQADAARAVRKLLAPGGTLVVVTFVHDGDDAPEGPPWPLHRDTVAILGDGLRESDRHVEELDDGRICIRLELVDS